jgi:hypothetical protein
MFNDSRYNNAFYFALGNIAAEITAQPLYSIKTNYQTTNEKSIMYTINRMYTLKGIFGFYNAIYTAIFTRIISAFIKFFVYNEIKHYRNTANDDLLNNMINGFLCGTISSICAHPIDTITNNLQRFKKINLIEFSLKALYRGFSQTLIRNAMLYSLLFPLFDYNKQLTDNVVLACVMTSFISSSILHPIEYIRTRYMAGMYDITWRNMKFKSLYKGWRINTFANVVHFTTAMTFAQYCIQKHKIN